MPNSLTTNTSHNRRLEDETEYRRIREEAWGESSAPGRPDILDWANRNVREPIEQEVVRRYPEVYGYQLKDAGRNRERATGTGRTRNQVQAGEQLASGVLEHESEYQEILREIGRGQQPRTTIRFGQLGR